jgi:ADP-ribose pyrophosphatase
MSSNILFKNKYLKYKNKYVSLRDTYLNLFDGEGFVYKSHTSNKNKFLNLRKQIEESNLILDDRKTGGFYDPKNKNKYTLLKESKYSNQLGGTTGPIWLPIGEDRLVYPTNDPREPKIERGVIPLGYEDWQFDKSGNLISDKEKYNPTIYTQDKCRDKPIYSIKQSYCDNEDPNLHKDEYNKDNRALGKPDRRSFKYTYKMDEEGRPLNPWGRTGIRGRGVFGYWGPNHSAFPIITRFKRAAPSKELVLDIHRKPIIEMVAIYNSNRKGWAIPGGLKEKGTNLSTEFLTEIAKEELGLIEITPELKDLVDNKMKELSTLFTDGTQIYRDIYADKRNTDNSWHEISVMNYHDPTGDIIGKYRLNSINDSNKLQWISITDSVGIIPMHLEFVYTVRRNILSSWSKVCN